MHSKKRTEKNTLDVNNSMYFIFSDYDSLRDVRKKNKKNDRIDNIDKEKYEINSLHVYSCYDFICKEIVDLY
jgi:hypothetical protein